MSGKVIGMARFFFAFCFFFVALTTAPVALAWGPVGHRLVAEVAATQLSTDARKQVEWLLQGEPDPTLAGIANWADNLRENDPDLGKRSARWHFVNLADHDCAYDPPRDCPDGNCVIAAIRTQTEILANPRLPREQRLQALKFVVHFVGDVHQPMHAGFARDKGGNDFQTSYNGKGGNLHKVWDSGLLASSGLDDAALLREITVLPGPPTDPEPALPPDATHWARQSCRIVLQPGVYPPRATLETSYYDTYRPIAEQQIRLAGDRLARLLNAALATH